MSEAMAMLEKVMAALHAASACLEEDAPDVDVANSHLARAAATLQAAMLELNPLLKAMAAVLPGLIQPDEKLGSAPDTTNLPDGWEKETL